MRPVKQKQTKQKTSRTPNPQPLQDKPRAPGIPDDESRKRDWANRIHNGDHERRTRGHGTPKPGPRKRKSNPDKK